MRLVMVIIYSELFKWRGCFVPLIRARSFLDFEVTVPEIR